MLTPLRRLAGPRGLSPALLLILWIGCLALRLAGAETQRRAFALPAGDAEKTLEAFSDQVGVQIVYLIEDVRGIRTNPVKGDFTIREALQQLVVRTELRVGQDSKTSAFVVTRERKTPVATKETSQTTPSVVPPMKKNLPARLAAALVAFTAAVMPAQTDSATAANNAEPEAEKVQTLPTFEIKSGSDSGYVGTSSLSTTRIAVDLSELPQSVTVLNNSFLKALNPLNLVDALNYVGGAQTGNLGFTAGRVNIRGFSGDGDYSDGFSPSSAVNLDSVLFDRFEIVKGPSTIFLAADGSPGGIVNKITKSPLSQAATTITAQVGLFDANNISIDSTGPLTKDKSLLYRVVMAQQYSDGYYDTTKLHRFSLMPQLSYQLNPGGKIELKALFVNAIFPSYTSIPVDPRTLQVFDLPRSKAQTINAPFQWYFHDNVKRVWMNFTQRLNDHAVLRIGAMDATDSLHRVVLQATTYNEGTRAFRVPNYDGTQSFPFAVIADDSINDYHDLQSDLNLNFSTGPVSHNLLLGGELNRGVVNRVTFPGVSTPWNPYVNVAPVVSVDFKTITANQANENTFGRVFILDTAKLFRDRLLLSYGVSRVRADAAVLNKLTGIYTTPTYVLYKNLKQYGAVYKVVPGLSLFTGYNENYSLNGIGTLNGVSGPLPAKLGKQAEVGLKSEFFQKKLTVNVSYFDIKQLNNTLPSVPFDPANPNILIPGVISRGFDGDVSWQVNRNLYLMGSMGWYDAKSVLGPAAATFVQPYFGRIVTGSIPDANTAEHTASLFTLYKFNEGALRGFDAGVGVNYQSKKAVTDSANQVMFGYIPGRTLVSLNASYQMNRHLRYTLNVDNLFNTRYYFGVRNENQIVIGDRTNVKVSASYTF